MTVVPPLVVPDVGVSEVTVGVGAVKMYSWAVPDVPVPPAVVTLTFTAPATWGLVLAWTTVGLVTVKDVAAVAPKWTAVAPMNPVPVILTVVPPLVVPDVGVSEVTVGVGAVELEGACGCDHPCGGGDLDVDCPGCVRGGRHCETGRCPQLY